MNTFYSTKYLLKIKPYIHLSRIQKPIGFLLLWIPCLWGISQQEHILIKAAFYLIGAISLRTFGCIINDIWDKDFDQKVERTKSRPLASGALTVKQALIFGFFSIIPGFLLFLLSDKKFLILIVLLGAILYPLAKRFTYWPQLILGFLFNSGILLTAKTITTPILCLYGTGIFWTLAYDTIYAFQDMKDDLMVGVKSIALKFRNYPKLIIGIFYSLMMLFLLLSGFFFGKSWGFYIGFILLCLELVRIIVILDCENGPLCQKLFIHNQWIGFWVLLMLLA